MGSFTRVKVAAGLGTPAERLEQARANVTRARADLDQHDVTAQQTDAKRLAALDDQAAHAQLVREAFDLRGERERLERLVARAESAIPALERAVKVEAFGDAQVQARKLREQLLRSVAAVVEAQTALDSASKARDAIVAEGEAAFAALRALATELGEPAPIARWSAGVVAAAALLSAQYPVARRKIQEKADALSREMPRELWQRSIDTDFAELERQYRLMLLELHGLNDPFEVTEAQYSNADRLRDLETDPARYEQRVSKIIHESAVKNEALRVAFELSERERAERERAERMGVQGPKVFQ